MRAETFAEMNEVEFEELIDGYIERQANGYGEMPADIFFDLLLERMAVTHSEPVKLEIAVDSESNGLLITPDREMSDIAVHGNEILVGGHRLVLELTSQTT